MLDVVKDGQSAYCNQLTLGLIVYFTTYKNSDILLADDVLKQERLETFIIIFNIFAKYFQLNQKASQSWEPLSTGPILSKLSTESKPEIAKNLPYVISLFEQKDTVKFNFDQNQRNIITDYIIKTTDNYHLISAYFKGFGTSDPGTEALLINACKSVSEGKHKHLSKMMLSYWKRKGVTV